MSIYFIIIYAVCGIYMLLNFKYDIQMLQQNSYRIPRYWRWLRGNMGSAWRLTDVALLFLLMSTLLDVRLSALLVTFVLIVKSIILFRRKYKKPLVFTKRVWRIYILAAAVSVSAYTAVAICTAGNNAIFGSYPAPAVTLGTLLMLTIFSWVPVMAALIMLIPVELAINRRYYNDAARILGSMSDLTVIGITGSYGKTSTKHYLNRILSESYDVLMTPGSYNTTMGVIRTIREYMKPYNQVFICEMGAKQPGDIKEICDLVHPHTGIVTAVGPMHLESFKTIENVQRTKFELVDSLPADGLAVINNDFDMAANRRVDNVKTIRYGVASDKDCQYHTSDITYTPHGTEFTLHGPLGFEHRFTTRLVGECNISNLTAAIITAVDLAVPLDRIEYAVGRIEQVEHRLNIKQTPGGVTIIDDAFNSNPAGSRMAVDVLSHFNDGKRIIVTPGMIELGDRQHELNRELGAYIGANVDVAVIVGQYNRDALTEGARSAGISDDSLYIVDSFAEAQKVLSTILAKGDTVLYENDLPDTFR